MQYVNVAVLIVSLLKRIMKYFKSYGRLYQDMYEHFRHLSLYQNRPIRADFIITTTNLVRALCLFPTSVIFQAFKLLNSRAVPVNW